MINHLEQNRKFAIIFTIFMAVEIFVVSSIPGSVPLGKGIDLSTAYHFIAFFLLNFFFILSVNGIKKPKTKHMILVPMASFLYAVLDEVHQIFVPLRAPTVFDIMIDLLGICMSVLVYAYYKKHSNRIRKK